MRSFDEANTGHNSNFSKLAESPGMRSPASVMRLARLGSFHASRLSFLRVLLRRMHKQGWQFQRPVWQMDDEGYGVATYQMSGEQRTYTLVVFSHRLADADRSDRVIAEAWDATFTLHDGIPTEEDLQRLSQHVPKQEGGRLTDSELTLSRANKSVRLFNYVTDCLAQGRQPDSDQLTSVGYLMRTTAVYGASKFGSADRTKWSDREEFTGSFQPEMLSVWLIRTFTIDLVEHIAKQRSPQTAVALDSTIKQSLGVGNSTGLGMAPFLVNHPMLLHRWIHARETALARVREIDVNEENTTTNEQNLAKLRHLIAWNRTIAQEWQSVDERQQTRIGQLLDDLSILENQLQQFSPLSGTAWNDLYGWSESTLGMEAQELLVSMLIELYPDTVDELATTMHALEEDEFPLDGQLKADDFLALVENTYDWTLNEDFSQPQNNARVWYVSQNKLEPRLGERHEEPLEPYEQPLSPARDICRMHTDLVTFVETPGNQDKVLAEFLMQHPEHRHIARRALTVSRYPYAELRDNTIAAEMLPIDMLRCKLSFFGATHAPFPDEIADVDPDDMLFGFVKD